MRTPAAVARYGLRAGIACLLLTTSALAVEHPGTIPAEAECSSCHGDKLKGKSVHSAMQSPCTVCHVTMVQGDMTTVSLLMPKNKICSACHADSAALRQHVPASASNKATCVDCHDAHSSEQKMLLRDVAMLGSPAKK